MTRTTEAILSRSNMSTLKTIYVEGNLDMVIVDDFLKNQNLKNVNVIPINEYIIDDDKPVCERKISKNKIIDLIKRSNNDVSIEKRYLGIIDTDFDYITGFLRIDNLYYTDLNCIESYLIDCDLFNSIVKDHCKHECIDSDDIEIYLDYFDEFNKLFYFQVSQYTSLEKDELICFDNLSFGSVPWINEESYEFDTAKLLELKCKESLNFKRKYNEFIENHDIEHISSNRRLFLHGKYLLRYIISILKDQNDVYKRLSESVILNILKDKFLIHLKYKQYALFEEVSNFAKAI